MPAAGHNSPPPSDIRPLRFLPRRSRLHSVPGEKWSRPVQTNWARRGRGNRLPASHAAERTRRAARSWRRSAEATIRACSFYDLSGAGEDRWGDGQPERLCRLEVDDQLEGGRLLNRQIGGLLALEDPSDVGAELTPCAGEAGCVAD